jgi:hypothetical protein
MNCDCHTKVNEKLREMNLKLVGYAFIMPGFVLTPQIATEWIDKEKAPRGQKRNPTAMLASHCPFCGQKIEQKEEKETDDAGDTKPA